MVEKDQSQPIHLQRTAILTEFWSFPSPSTTGSKFDLEGGEWQIDGIGT
jgi:hypothetical protein